MHPQDTHEPAHRHTLRPARVIAPAADRGEPDPQDVAALEPGETTVRVFGRCGQIPPDRAMPRGSASRHGLDVRTA